MKTPSDPQEGAKKPQDCYKICWHIFRCGNKHLPFVKMYGKNCPCTHDPIDNPKCPDYEEVLITRT